MNSLTILLSVVAVVLIARQTDAAGAGCPLPSKVYGCTPKCLQNYECSNGKVCCANACNAKSCVDVNGLSGAGGQDKYSQSGGAGTYCNNVKCNSFEVCKLDPATKRMKCMRA
ncbi:uncharacterized protein LOC121730692 [Aricia agestis]|uniref:uncharacterized protein LOC121730692 n=1 Tax=Aricia agestis TaxID=91739 RepID=UPI001C20237D|nr:uncharacterized protein LOC121730692 [Aricia agestis]